MAVLFVGHCRSEDPLHISFQRKESFLRRACLYAGIYKASAKQTIDECSRLACDATIASGDPRFAVFDDGLNDLVNPNSTLVDHEPTFFLGLRVFLGWFNAANSIGYPTNAIEVQEPFVFHTHGFGAFAASR